MKQKIKMKNAQERASSNSKAPKKKKHTLVERAIQDTQHTRKRAISQSVIQRTKTIIRLEAYGQTDAQIARAIGYKSTQSVSQARESAFYKRLRELVAPNMRRLGLRVLHGRSRKNGYNDFDISLVKRYHSSGYNDREIMLKSGLSRQRVRNIRKILGLRSNACSGRVSDSTWDDAHRLRKSGLSKSEVMSRTGIGSRSISKIFPHNRRYLCDAKIREVILFIERNHKLSQCVIADRLGVKERQVYWLWRKWFGMKRKPVDMSRREYEWLMVMKAVDRVWGGYLSPVEVGRMSVIMFL